MPVIVSRATKSLVLPITGQMDTLFPVAPTLSDGSRVVKHGLIEAAILRNLGYKVPNPMLAYYDWAGGKPFDIQRATCAMLTDHPRSYVLNDMGRGKTRAALWAWDWLKKTGYAGNLQVVAPLPTLNFVWARDA